MEAEHLKYRFGFIAVKKGFVTPEQVVGAFEIQLSEDLSTGSHKRMGEILLEQGLLDQSQLDEVLQTLKQPNSM